MTGRLTQKLDGTRCLYVEFTEADMMRAKFTAHDRAMLREKPNGIADWLLDAELIARRIEEAHAKD